MRMVLIAIIKLFFIILTSITTLLLCLLFLSWYTDPTQHNLPREYHHVTALYTGEKGDSGLCIWYKDYIDANEYVIIEDYYTGKDWLLGNYKYTNTPVKVLKSNGIPQNWRIRNFEYIN